MDVTSTTSRSPEKINAAKAKFLRSVYLRHFPVSDQPTILWHYTTAEKFLKIIESGELWFTHVSCLNDTQEIQLAAGVTRRAIDRLEKKYESHPQLAKPVERLSNYSRETLLEHNTESQWFVSSYSESEDDLNQWQKYAGAVGGVAIGFDKNMLEVAFASDPNKGASLWKAIYNVQELDKFADEIAEITLQEYLDFIEENQQQTNDPNSITTRFMEYWGPLVDELSVVAKSTAFESEKEWRLTVHENDFAASDLRFLARTTTISRHVRIQPKDMQERYGVRLPISRVYLGPSGRPEITEASVKALLNRYGYIWVKPERSKLPFQVM